MNRSGVDEKQSEAASPFVFVCGDDRPSPLRSGQIRSYYSDSVGGCCHVGSKNKSAEGIVEESESAIGSLRFGLRCELANKTLV